MFASALQLSVIVPGAITTQSTKTCFGHSSWSAAAQTGSILKPAIDRYTNKVLPYTIQSKLMDVV